MKGMLRAEILGDDVRQKFKIARNIFNDAVPGARLGDKEFSTPSSTWCAEITGFDTKYKYQRRFVRGKKDYSTANGNGSRGIYYEWIMDSGHIYEVKEQTSWSKTIRYFCTVSENGNVIKLSKGEVDNMLKKLDELKKMTDKALLDYAASLNDDGDESFNTSDAIMDILEDRHGEKEADRIWSNRFGDNDA